VSDKSDDKGDGISDWGRLGVLQEEIIRAELGHEVQPKSCNGKVLSEYPTQELRLGIRSARRNAQRFEAIGGS
jgi:hypothetical protein